MTGNLLQMAGKMNYLQLFHPQKGNELLRMFFLSGIIIQWMIAGISAGKRKVVG